MADKKLICVLFLMVLAVAMMDAGNPPFNVSQRRVGKRNSKRIVEKRELCARARVVCDVPNDVSNREIPADFGTEEI